MNHIDVRILNCLKENARLSASSIGARVNMSVSAVIERIRKMEHSNIIEKYTIVLNNSLINKNLCVLVSVSLEHPKYNQQFSDTVKRNNEIAECYYITGEYDFFLKIVTQSTQTLECVLNDIKGIPGVSLTRTLVVLSTVKRESTVLPDDPSA